MQLRRAVAVGLAALMVAGCGSSTPTGTPTGTQGGPATSSAPSFGRLKILMVSGSLTQGPFFQAANNGMEQAGKDLGVDVEWIGPQNYDNLGPDMANLIQVATNRKPDGLAISNFVPDAEDPAIQQAVAAGIPVVIFNGGSTSWEKVGAITFIGQDEVATGRAAARKMLDAGVKQGLCVNHVPQNPATQGRCAGFEAVFEENGAKGDTFNIPINQSTDPTAIQAAIKGQLLSNPAIDGVFTLGSGVADAAVGALADAGKADTVKLGTTDLSANVLGYVKDGKLLFAIDQMPWLQGYYGVLVLTWHLRLGMAPSLPVAMGPNMLTKDNVQQVIDLQKSNPGTRE